MVFHNGCTNLHSHKQCARVPVPPCSLIVVMFCLFANRPSSWSKVAPQWVLNLHCSDEQWERAHFQVLTVHLHSSLALVASSCFNVFFCFFFNFELVFSRFYATCKYNAKNTMTFPCSIPSSFPPIVPLFPFFCHICLTLEITYFRFELQQKTQYFNKQESQQVKSEIP